MGKLKLSDISRNLEKKQSKKDSGQEETLEVVGMFMKQTAVRISQVCTYLQTPQVMHIKYVQIWVCQSYVRKVNKTFYIEFPLTCFCLTSFLNISKDYASKIRKEKKGNGATQWRVMSNLECFGFLLGSVFYEGSNLCLRKVTRAAV